MQNWPVFGEQVNRLVYSLAVLYFRANIEKANRYVAERIIYSESSVRMMRQGRFVPKDPNALKKLVDIGLTEAQLDRKWAERLLEGAKLPAGLQSTPAQSEPDEQPAAEVKASKSPFTVRLLAGGLGLVFTLAVWSLAVHNRYPAPHELSELLEGLWGLLVGAGLAVGLALADRLGNQDPRDTPWKSWKGWRCYLVLPASGFAGGLAWNSTAQLFARATTGGAITSSWPETLAFGAVYGLVFGAGTLLACRLSQTAAADGVRIIATTILLAAALAIAGFWLAASQPAFANQKDIDVFVGVLLRLALALSAAAFFPGWSTAGQELVEPDADLAQAA